MYISSHTSFKYVNDNFYFCKCISMVCNLRFHKKNKNKCSLYNVLFDKKVVRLLPTNFEVTWEFLVLHAMIQLCVAGDGELALRARFTSYHTARAARSSPTTFLALRARFLICCSRFALAALALRARVQN